MNNKKTNPVKREKKCKKLKKSLFVCVFLIFLFISLILAFIIHAKIIYRDFYSAAHSQFQIPEINAGFVPQGIDYCKNEDVFLVSGYADDGASKIFVVEPNGSYRKLSVFNADGSNFINHAGGISQFGDYIYLAGCDGKCYVLNRDSVINNRSESAQVIGSFDVYNNADYCYVKDNRLYVGEFYQSLKYDTDNSHHFITPAGDNNNAIITVFELAEENSFGVGNIPVEVYSTTGAVQGMCITESDEIILSASVLFISSKLYSYKYSNIYNSRSDTFSINEVDVPLYHLDSEILIKTTIAPPKSEGLAYVDKRIYIIFESASNKFILGKFIGGEYVYSIEISH